MGRLRHHHHREISLRNHVLTVHVHSRESTADFPRFQGWVAPGFERSLLRCMLMPLFNSSRCATETGKITQHPDRSNQSMNMYELCEWWADDWEISIQLLMKSYELCGDVRNPKIACQSHCDCVSHPSYPLGDLISLCAAKKGGRPRAPWRCMSSYASMMRRTNRVIQKNYKELLKHIYPKMTNIAKLYSWMMINGDKCKPDFVCSTDCSRLYVAKWCTLHTRIKIKWSHDDMFWPLILRSKETASYRLQLLWLSAMPKTLPVLFIDEALLPESRQFSSHSLSREATTK